MSPKKRPTPLIVDGHVHITNRVYWEGIDPWDPQPFGFDFAKAAAAGVGVVIENVAPYGYDNYDATPKQALRLIETLLRTVEAHEDRMAVALSGTEARSIAESGRTAVVIGIESGFDHDGDVDVLHALHRLGLRLEQFSTQTCFNAFADSEADGPPVWNGINQRGRDLVAAMNELGVLIDLTHATPEAQLQLVEASRAPVVASHVSMAAVSGAGMADDTVRAIAAKGGTVGIIGASTDLSAGYREWIAARPAEQQQDDEPVEQMIEFHPSRTRPARDHGEFGDWFDGQSRAHHLAAFQPWVEHPDAADLVPTAQDWAAHVRHAVDLVGAEHVGIGLDLVGGRSCVPQDASGYGELLAALGDLGEEDRARIAGTNWITALDSASG